MKNIKDKLKLIPAILLFPLIVGLSTCEHRLENKENPKEQFIEDDSVYDYLTLDEAKSLGELEKIYQEMYNVKQIIDGMNYYHAGEEEEAYSLRYKTLEKMNDSITGTLSALGKKDAKGIYNAIFNSDN